MPRDLKAEAEAYEERLAICMFDGGLTQEQAQEVAEKQLWATIRRDEHDDKANYNGK